MGMRFIIPTTTCDPQLVRSIDTGELSSFVEWLVAEKNICDGSLNDLYIKESYCIEIIVINRTVMENGLKNIFLKLWLNFHYRLVFFKTTL